MEVIGIIAEYNPFHNGHLYHLEASKKASKTDYTVCVMSGNFVQRGETSLIDKWTKTKMALSNGIDLVIELPNIYAISSAENFAYGAVKILESLGIVDTLSFGSECGDIKALSKIADLLYLEPEDYKKLLTMELQKGLSFPNARENAISNYFNNPGISDLVSKSNNILGIEYLKALKKLNSNINPMTIIRKSVDYNEKNINGNFASATGIREIIKNNGVEAIKRVVPLNVYNLLEKSEFIYDINSFEKEIVYALRKMSITEIKNLPDVSEGLENSIKTAVNNSNNLQEIIDKIKSKRYTQTRIQRIMLYALLGISKEDLKNSINMNPYIRILGMNSDGKKLLSKISSNINVITSVKKFLDESTVSTKLKNMLEKDILSSNIYTLAYSNNSVCNLDYTKKIIEL